MSDLTPFIKALDDSSLSRKFTARRADKSIKWAAEKLYALEIIKGSDQLLSCSPNSVKLAMISLASMGLSLDPTRGHAYLIPRKTTAYATPSYKGLRFLAMQTPEIANIQCELVREGDPEFRHGMDQSGPYVVHEAARKDRGEVTHAYCVTFFAGGTRQVEVMERWELDQVKELAKTAQKGKLPFTWMKWEGEMQKKSVARRAAKHWPIGSGRVAQAIKAMDEAEPITAEPTITEKQAENLLTLMDKCGLDKSMVAKNLCASYGVDRLRDLPSSEIQNIRQFIQQTKGAA